MPSKVILTRLRIPHHIFLNAGFYNRAVSDTLKRKYQIDCEWSANGKIKTVDIKSKSEVMCADEIKFQIFSVLIQKM